MDCKFLPEGDSPGHWVIAMNDKEDSPHKLIHIEDLVQVFDALLGHLQNTLMQEVIPARPNALINH